MVYFVYKEEIRDRDVPVSLVGEVTYFLIPGKIKSSITPRMKLIQNPDAGQIIPGSSVKRVESEYSPEFIELNTTKESYIPLGMIGGRNYQIYSKKFKSDSLDNLVKEYHDAWDEIYKLREQEMQDYSVRKLKYPDEDYKGMNKEQIIKKTLKGLGYPVVHLHTDSIPGRFKNDGEKVIVTSGLSLEEMDRLYSAVLKPHMHFYNRFTKVVQEDDMYSTA